MEALDADPRVAARELATAGAPRSPAPSGSGPVATNHAPGLSFMVDDVRHWEPQSLPDVIVCNAVLQWVPGHRELLLRWAGWLADDGWLAIQVPGNFDQPSHAILREMAASARWLPLLRDAELNRQSADPAGYAELLAEAGCEVDAWETTYVHILAGDDPVLEWYKGTGLRPVLDVLDAEAAQQIRDRERGQGPGGEDHPVQDEQVGERRLLGKEHVARGEVRPVVPGRQHVEGCGRRRDRYRERHQLRLWGLGRR